MLDDLQRHDDRKPQPLRQQLLRRPDPISRPLGTAMRSRRRDHLVRRVDPGHIEARRR